MRERLQQQHLFNYLFTKIIYAFLHGKLHQLVVMTTRNNHRVKDAKWPFGLTISGTPEATIICCLKGSMKSS